VNPQKSTIKLRPLCKTSRDAAKEARERATREGTNPELAEHAALIRERSKRVIADIIEIGHRLHLAKQLVEYGGWAAWLDKEFGWSDDTALNFIHVFELSEKHDSRNFRDLKIAPSALYLLARKSTPDATRDAIIERAEAGETINLKTVRESLPRRAEQADEREEPTTSPTNDWREDLRRGFGEALTIANDAIRFGQQLPAMYGDVHEPLLQQMREAYEPSRSELPEILKGGQVLLDFVRFVEGILADAEPLVPAEAAE
jgi:hypothetical protein